MKRLALLLILFAAPAHAQNVHVRVLVLTHAWEPMAHSDANLAVTESKRAAKDGLPIKVFQSTYIGGWKMKEVEDFVSKRMCQYAEIGDTFVIHTIGHGHGNGMLQGLGHRKDVTRAIANAAGKNQQKVIWWQLSCHACAGLPKIDELPTEQQQYVTMIATSSAQEMSPAGVHGKVMGRVFGFLATRRNRAVTTREVREVMGKRNGDLVFTNREVLFGAGNYYGDTKVNP